MLLGGDGLPTLSTASKMAATAGDDGASAEAFGDDADTAMETVRRDPKAVTPTDSNESPDASDAGDAEAEWAADEAWIRAVTNRTRNSPKFR